jgi:hypothetical protein
MIEIGVIPYASLTKSKARELNQKYKCTPGKRRMIVMEFENGLSLITFGAKPITRARYIHSVEYPGELIKIGVSKNEFEANRKIINTLYDRIESPAIIINDIPDKNGEHHAYKFVELNLDEWINLCQFLTVDGHLELPPMAKLKQMTFDYPKVNQFLFGEVVRLRDKYDSYNYHSSPQDPVLPGRWIDSKVGSRWFRMTDKEYRKMVVDWNIRYVKSKREHGPMVFGVPYNELVMLRRKVNYLHRLLKKGEIKMVKHVGKVTLSIQVPDDVNLEFRLAVKKAHMTRGEFIEHLLKLDRQGPTDLMPNNNETNKSINALNKNMIKTMAALQKLESTQNRLVDLVLADYNDDQEDSDD